MNDIDIAKSGNYIGDCRDMLKRMPDACAQTCVTSPPYWGLRDYGVAGQIGLELTPDEYVRELVAVFSDVRRVLRDDGTLWLNLGDSYAGSRSGPQGKTGEMVDREVVKHRAMQSMTKAKGGDPKNPRKGPGWNDAPNRQAIRGLKYKDLVGIPWMVAFALRADGWWLRQDIIWSKPNPMPESVLDRCTKAHEYLFLLSKSERYYYDSGAIKEQCEWGDHPRNGVPDREDDKAPGQPCQSGISKVRRSGNKERKAREDHGGVAGDSRHQAFGVPWTDDTGTRNRRSVWTVATQPFSGAHFATMPPNLVEPCVLAGSRVGDLVLDPFFGSGTTGMVAEKHGRKWIGFDLNPEYEKLQNERTAQRSLLGLMP